MPPVLSSEPENDTTASPFHAGEQSLQRENGSREMMEQFGRKVIRPYMPEQHRTFFAQLPFLVVGAVDSKGWPWATVLPGRPGFVQSPDNRHLDIALHGATSDPVRQALRRGAAMGILGIELHSRRRNRMNGHITELNQNHVQVRVDQSFGNCPQYIQHREVEFVRPAEDSSPARPSARFNNLDEAARSLIAQADVFFVASSVDLDDKSASNGVDVSHRGGRPGFIKIDKNSLLIPDFPGNNHFNTFGNFLLNPKAGLVFPDFTTGTLLMLTGEAELLPADAPELSEFRGAERGWRFRLHHGLWLMNALPFRAQLGAFSPNSLMADTWPEVEARRELEAERNSWRRFRVARVQQESSTIRSFYFEPVDGKPLLPFEAGQFLSLRARSRGGILTRSYTVSSAPGEAHYRISVKREENGQMSRLLHDEIMPGDILDLKAPRGAFVLDPAETRPAVLLAGGIGITPMVSMANHVLREGLRTRHLRQLTVLHAAKDTSQRAFAETFHSLQRASEGQIRYLSFVSNPTPDDRPGTSYNGTGRITADTLRQVLPLDDYDFFLCGPPGFMQGIYDSLRELGVADSRIFAEGFGPASLTRTPDPISSSETEQNSQQPPEADSAQVVFAQKGSGSDHPERSEHDWHAADGTLLEFAEAKGFNPAFGCRSGSCGNCAASLNRGHVSYRTSPATSITPGEVLLCCARPAKGSEPLEIEI